VAATGADGADVVGVGVPAAEAAADALGRLQGAPVAARVAVG